MNSKNLRRLLSAALLLALLLSLIAMQAGCAAKPEAEPENTPEITPAAAGTPPAASSAPEKPAAAKKPEKPEKNPSLHGGEAANPAQPAAQDDASLLNLRAQMDGGDGDRAHFAVAYLGYVGGLFDEGFGKGFPKWLAENDPRQLEQNPFLTRIDENHIIGGAGHLYCIVPHDENASVAVNRVHWDGTAMGYVADEVVYRAETGEPILLFANLDGDESITDTVVTVVSENGAVCEWYPALNIDGTVMLPGEAVGGLPLDFTQYADVGAGEFGDWLANGWLGPTALSLAGSADMGGLTWTVAAQARDGRSAFFMLTFYPGDETGGEVDLDWSYDGQTDEYEEQWFGWWTLKTEPDQPSYVTLDLTRVGGANYAASDGPIYLSETYPVLLAPSGESLLFAAGRNSIPLPFMENGAERIELLLAVG